MSEVDYHLMELEIARARDNPRRVAPVLHVDYESVLDIGCGAGQTLIASRSNIDTFHCGVDIDEEALALGKRLSRHITFVRASGERLPFRDQSFEVVISRVALPYMHIPDALREIARVLRPGGQVWFTLHSISMALLSAARAIIQLNAKSLIYQHYVILNGLLFHFAGKQFRFPFNPDKCESFQTASGIVRAMRAAGFEDVRVDRDGFFVVTGSRQV